MATEESFTCPECGHTFTFRPEECEVIVRFKPTERGIKEIPFRLVRCPACGKEHLAPPAP